MAAGLALLDGQCSSQRYWTNNEAFSCCFQYPIPLSEEDLLVLLAAPMLGPLEK